MAMRFDDDWALEQTNRPLMNEREAGYAYVASLEADVKFHGERWKNWDNYLAVYHGVRGGMQEPILDAGACRDPKSPSAFLPSMQAQGYTRLYGCNLDEPGITREGGITYTRDDITKTRYEDEFFRYVACLSTIEHGVNEFAFLAEMYRVLKPGGSLFVSFDYWHDQIDTGGRLAFGVPVRIFNLHDVSEMLMDAQLIGFDLMDDSWTFQCGDPVVKWLGLEYTFMNLLLRKPTALRTGC